MAAMTMKEMRGCAVLWRSRLTASVLSREPLMSKWLKSRLWDVETTALGAPEVYIIGHKVPRLRRLARTLRRDDELVVILILAIVATAWGIVLLCMPS